MSSRSSQYVEVQLEIGHRATPKTKHSPEGHTHDWTVFVRGPENSNIQHFVEKVVFHLHDSFPKPKRVVKEPPYQVSESGYASFELPVEVYFKNKEEPKKISFDYDLYLRLDDAVSHSRREKLTFQNPSNDFKKKLLKAGGITNESNVSVAKSGVISDEKPTPPPTSSTNVSKPFKPSVSGSESKKSKTSGVIPSKDKSLNNFQNASNASSSQPTVSEKHPISSNNKQFTDLFGTPIQARPPSESKNKESCVKSKFTAIASKGVKSDSKSLNKNSTKKTHSSPSHKSNENKSLKDTKESKASKDSKVSTKAKESSKSKREDGSTLNKSKKKNQSQQQSQQSPKNFEIDKKSDSKSSKKRRNSTSSTSSSLTASSFTGSTESKLHKEEAKIGSIKEKENKKENKKQKVSSKDTNTASGVKKQSSTSTKISFSDNNSSTTIEIKSVKKEKTWDNEVKKSRSKEFKSSEFKAAKDKDNANSSSASVGVNKTKTKVDPNCVKSGKPETNKNSKTPKEKNNSRVRKRSTSPSSDSRLTPGLSSPPSNSGANYLPTHDMESHDSLSPLSTDNTSVSSFKPIRNNNENNNQFISDDSDSDSAEESLKKNNIPKKKLSEATNKKKTQNSISQINKRKKEVPKVSNKRLNQSKTEGSVTPVTDFKDTLFSNDLIEIQKRISESTNSDLLQAIVDIIEESGLFLMTKTTFEFDLMKLDDKTIKRLKTYLY